MVLNCVIRGNYSYENDTASTKLSIRWGRPDSAATGVAPCVRVLLPKCTTTSMEQSASWGAKSLSTSQETLRILWNPRVHYLAHKSPPTVPILSHNYPVQTSPTPFCFLKPSFIFILPSAPRSYKWFFPSFPPQKSCMHFFSPHCDIYPFISFFLMCHPNSIWGAVKITMLLGMKYPPFFRSRFPFRPKYNYDQNN
jgi:hypothetical protein